MSNDQDQHAMIMRQMSILIYNQPMVQAALTAVTRAARTHDDVTAAGVAFVRAVTEVGCHFAQSPDKLAEAMQQCPTEANPPAADYGLKPSLQVHVRDVIRYMGEDRIVASMSVDRDVVTLYLAPSDRSLGTVLSVAVDYVLEVVKTGG